MIRWEKEDILEANYIEEAKKSIEADFKILIQVEEGKEK